MRASTTLAALICLAAVPFSGGCGKVEQYEGPIPTGSAASAATDTAEGAFDSKISDLMNKISDKYRHLEYDYDEDLLAVLDRVEDRLSGKTKKLEPLPMPKLDEAEQLAHFEEVIKRWSAKTKRTLRAELDPLKAEVAARKKAGGPAFHPDFHKKFSVAFDTFVPIEVEEIRERRNKALHEAAKPLFDEFRSKAPEAVKRAEDTLNNPPYNLSGTGST